MAANGQGYRSFSNATREPARGYSGGALRMSSVNASSGWCSPNQAAAAMWQRALLCRTTILDTALRQA